MKTNIFIIFIILLLYPLTLNAEGIYEKLYGVNIDGQWDTSYVSSDSGSIANWLPGVNANWATVQVTWFQDSLFSNKIYQATSTTKCSTRTPTDDSLKKYINSLHEKGLKVILKFYVYVDGWCNDENLWFGNIQPTNIDEWFTSYRAAVLKYSKIAEETKAEIFSFGNELRNQSGNYREEHWGPLIKEIRGSFKGKLIYCAAFPNRPEWVDAEYNSVVFWDLVDYIGINFWPSAQPPVSESGTPSVEQIKEAYRPFKTLIDNWYDSNNFSNKIIITEFGSPNRDYCVDTPYNAWLNNTTNEFCQKNSYEAHFQVFHEDYRITGMFSHEDLVDHVNDDKYQIKGRAAESVLSYWFKKMRESSISGKNTNSLSGINLLLLDK